ncbi:hypothetical protein ES708_28444 [subsurface metagenome]
MFLFGGLNVLLWLGFVRLVWRRNTLWPAERLRAVYYHLVNRESSLIGLLGSHKGPDRKEAPLG